MKKSSIVAIFFLLSQVYFISAFPLNCSLPEDEPVEGSGIEEEEEETNAPDTTSSVLNDYSLQLFFNQRRLKDSNCTEQFLGQNVSRHLCNSTTIKFKFPRGTETTGGEDFSYEMCTTQGNPAVGTVLGYDAVLYKRPTPQRDSNDCYLYEEFTIFITETVGENGFDDILSHEIINSDAEGWQIFQLNERINERLNMTTTIICLTIHVLGKEGGNATYELLNRTQLEEMFVLNDNNIDEEDKQPVIVQYIFKPVDDSGVSPFMPSQDPFPFFKRSLLQPFPVERDDSCSVEDKFIKLTDGFPHSSSILVSPRIVNVGKCSVLCRPTKFTHLELLHYSTSLNDLTVDIMPNATIVECAQIKN